MKEIALNFLDIANNSIRAGCSLLEVTLKESVKDNIIALTIKDDGCGMDAETLNKVTDPFFSSRTTRHIGLGVPFLKQHAEMAGGDFKIQSIKGVGTTVYASFQYDHPDRQPLGDIPDVILMLIASNPEINYTFHSITDDGEILFDTREVKDALGNVPVNDPEVLKLLKDMMIVDKND